MQQTKKQSVSKIYRTDPLLRQHLVCLESEWMNLQDVSFREKKGSCQVFFTSLLKKYQEVKFRQKKDFTYTKQALYLHYGKLYFDSLEGTQNSNLSKI